MTEKIPGAANASTSVSVLDFKNLAIFATIPPSCNNTCNAIEDTITDCPTTQCICASANGAALKTCVDCLESVKTNASIIEQAQEILEQYAELCDASGISVPVETASGFTGSVGLPSASAVGVTGPPGPVSLPTPSLGGTSTLSSGVQQTTIPAQSSAQSSTRSSATAPSSPASASASTSSTASTSGVIRNHPVFMMNLSNGQIRKTDLLTKDERTWTPDGESSINVVE
ncbi:hypothetical protein D9757_008829 [Collybiopsis confluens]|uniref:Uncharacterized protein n=1 Tax=Collybiopsis confluens TaxID=2823264 RepID=A0A8H5H3G7_9AGAR|nr:hypothetical protein D9757_008829 [Collybiopsis confluens]